MNDDTEYDDTEYDDTEYAANLQDIYRLTPLQEGILFHALRAPESNVYVTEMSCELSGHLDDALFRRAWRETVDRHPILRSAFLWQGLEHPVQVVHRRVEVAVRSEDWRALPAGERSRRQAELEAEERERPFDLSRPPLMRLTVVREAADRCRLLWSVHHLLLDGWSTHLVLEEVLARHEAALRGRAATLAPARPFRAYVEWLAAQDPGAAEAFWRRRLEGFRAPTPLGVDRPAAASGREGRRTVRIPAAKTAALRALARRSRLTLASLLQGAWALLLSRYSGRRDVLFGATVSGRPAELGGVESMVGMFVNTLPVRVRIDPGAGLLGWLGALQEHNAELRRFEHSPLAQVRRWSDLAPGRPLFESIVVFESYPTGLAAGDASRRLRLAGPIASRISMAYPLVLLVGLGPRLILRAVYDTGRFRPSAVGRLLGHLTRLLEAMAADHERRLGELEPLTAAERHQLLTAWNDTARPYPRHLCLHQLFAAQAARTPRRPAVVFGRRRLTYGELAGRVRRLARHLRVRGVGPGVVVGVLMERSLEMVIAVHAVVEAGGAYLPLEPSYPRQRLEFMLRDAGAPVLLTQRGLTGRLPASGAEVIPVDADLGGIPDHGSAPAFGATPDDLAYVIYTSGSTGEPKGVMNVHRAIVNRLLWMQDALALSDDDVVLQKTPFSFDVSVWELFWPLMVGARLVVARPEGHRDAAYLRDAVAEHGVTTLHFVPSMLQVFLDQPGLSACRSLRRVVASGETLPAALRDRFFELFGARLYNLYGPTEAAVDVTVRRCLPGDGSDVVPIGRPIANLEIFLGDDLGGVPAGVAGKLFIGGVGLARGYLARPRLTAERFVPDPSRRRPGARVYDSGDLARHGADGDVEFLGRRDHQVKLHGLRVELGEIEAALGRHPAVRDAVVRATAPEEAAGARLVAYVVPRRGRTLTVEEMRRHLAESLPPAVVPAALVILEALPLTGSGKVDRRSLPEVRPLRPRLETAFAAPRTAAETRLAEVWTEVLGLDRVGVHDNFFDLGGDSMRSIRVLSEARERGLGFTLQQLFDHPTIAELAGAAGGEGAGRAAAEPVAPFELVPAEDRARLPAGVEDAYPLTRLQAGMLFHSAYSPETAVYHNVNTLLVEARFDRGAMTEAVRRLAERHPILRTSFDLSSYSLPLQLVWKGARIPLAVRDLRPLPAGEQERAVGRWYEDEKRHKFDWSEAPLLRFAVHRRGEELFQLSWTEHHSILDGWSVASMISELFQDYLHLLGEAGPPVTAAPRTAFRDLVAQERRSLESAECRRFWSEALRGRTATRLPAAAGGPGAAGRKVRIRTVGLPRPVNEGLRKLASEAAVPLKTVLLAAHLRALDLLSGQPDVITGVGLNGRLEQIDGERVLGVFLNVVPFRLRLAPRRWVDLVKAVSEAERRLMPYRWFPLAEIQRLEGREPLYDTAFNYTHFHVLEGVFDHPAMKVRAKRFHIETHFAFTAHFTVALSSPEIRLLFEYYAGELSEELMSAAEGYYSRILASMAADPLAGSHSQCLLGREEAEQVLVEWNRTAAELGGEACVHRWIEARAAERPWAVAVSQGPTVLSYDHLNRWANRLARRLRGLGVAAETRVGVYLERSPELVVAFLAILKSGGAYVPLDALHPARRLRFMIEDSGMEALITRPRLSGEVPGSPAATVLLEGSRPGGAEEDAENLASGPRAEQLAYVIYTSGSTGRPKGVLIAHRGLANLAEAFRREHGFGPGCRVAQFLAMGFDGSVGDVAPALATGATLCLVTAEASSPGPELAAWMRDRGATHLTITPSALAALPAAPLPDLRLLAAAGERCPGELVDRWRGPHRFYNAYGPTEATVWAIGGGCAPGGDPPGGDPPGGDPPGGDPPIGRPIVNTRAYLADAALQPAPPEVTGELHLGGLGIARGYLGRAPLTAERFVPDPFSGEPGSRLYRTGDRARRRRDGRIDFLGRIDHQVKIRGFRIELGEIEATLAEHPAVREAAVAARSDGRGDGRLTGYVVCDPEHAAAGERSIGRQLREEQVSSWRTIFDQTFESSSEGEDPLADFTGWNSSYDGRPIPRREMQEWVEQTCGTVRALRPRRILEIGCGNGQLLLRLAPGCERYVGTDFSAPALRRLARHAESRGLFQVELLERRADDFAGLAEGSFDLVVLNSVVQYFPHVRYLVEVLEGAVKRLAPEGAVVVGDVRHHGLLEAFHATVELFRAAPDLGREELRERVRERLLQEQELLIEPHFFAAFARRLPRAAAAIRVKRGSGDNELNRFRYDAILTLGREGAEPGPGRWLDWRREKLDLPRLRRLLGERSADGLGVKAVPNARLHDAFALCDLLAGDDGPPTAGGLAEALRSGPPPAAVEPEALWRLAEELGLAAEVRWSSSGAGDLDVWFGRRPPAFPAWPAADHPWERYANNPLLGQLSRRLTPELRVFLKLTLPDCMIPAAFMVLDALPRTANGKLDRRALPAPGMLRSRGEDFVAPRSRPERRLAEIWAELLRLERVGIHDNFFELGGDSIVSIQIVARASRHGLRFTPKDLFEHQTIAELAAAARLFEPDAPTETRADPGAGQTVRIGLLGHEIDPLRLERILGEIELATGET